MPDLSFLLGFEYLRRIFEKIPPYRRMKKFAYIILILCLYSCRHETGIVRETINDLDATLEMKETYEKAFDSRIKSIREVYRSDRSYENQIAFNFRMANEFHSNNFDSTVFFLASNKRLASQHGDKERLAAANLFLVEVYAKAGYHIEANTLMQHVISEGIPAGQKLQYLRTRHTLAGELMYYASDDTVGEYQFDDRNKLRDSLMKYVTPGTYEWYNLNREAALSAKDSASVRKFAQKMMSMSKDKDLKKYASACYYYSEGVPGNQKDSALYWLGKSAQADIRAANKDYASLNMIAQNIFSRGDVDRAFKYCADHCMQDALSYNGKLRPWQISKFFPRIEHEYELRQRRQSRLMTGAVVFVSLLLALLALLSLHIFRHHQELARTNDELKSLNNRIKESDKIKEEYIALFLGMVSDNINKTRKYQNHILKYLKRGNEKYIIDEIEMLPPIDEDIKTFYKMFDETFLNLYPDFIEQFNALLAEGSAIVPKDNDMLTPELRIFALVKLGVSESSKIASLLHYSANTVYNYRAKIKNKSRVPREQFEDMVREIR